MAEILEVKTVVETQQSEKSVDGLLAAMKNLADVQKESLESQKKVAKDVEKSNKGAVSSTKKLSQGFKSVGLAIKLAGIGLLVSVVSALTGAFKNNQKFLDLFATVMGTLEIIGNKIIGVLSNVVDEVNESDNSFESVTKTVTGLITLALNPLKGIFFDLVKGIKMAQLAWELSLFGDKNPETIANLSKELNELDKAIAQNTTDMLLAGAQVAANYEKAMDTVSGLTTGIVKGIRDIDIASAVSTAKANVQLEKAAKLAEAKIRGLIESYDLQAEKQRQIRDDDTKSIGERIEANEELGRILQNQQAEQTKLAQIGVDAARAKLSIDKKNIDSQVALQQALNEVAATAAQVAGFESEQQTNRNSLLREQKQIIDELTLQGKSEQDRAIAEADQERTLRLEQAKLFIDDTDLMNKTVEAIEKEHTDTISKIKADALKKQDDDKKAADAITKADDKALFDIKVGLVSSGFNILQELAGKNEKAQKGIAAAQATFDTFAAVVGSLRAAQTSPGAAIPGYAIAQAVATGAFGLLQVKKILSTSTSGGSPASVSGGSGGGARPSTNTPRIPDFTANNQGVGGGSGFGTVRAVVVNQDIKDTAQMDNRVSDLIRIGT